MHGFRRHFLNDWVLVRTLLRYPYSSNQLQLSGHTVEHRQPDLGLSENK
jgi:hypothetical protein